MAVALRGFNFLERDRYISSRRAFPARSDGDGDLSSYVTVLKFTMEHIRHRGHERLGRAAGPVAVLGPKLATGLDVGDTAGERPRRGAIPDCQGRAGRSLVHDAFDQPLERGLLARRSRRSRSSRRSGQGGRVGRGAGSAQQHSGRDKQCERRSTARSPGRVAERWRRGSAHVAQYGRAATADQSTVDDLARLLRRDCEQPLRGERTPGRSRCSRPPPVPSNPCRPRSPSDRTGSIR